MIISAFKRVFFYGSIVLACVVLVRYLGVSITGEFGFKIFSAMGVVNAILHGVNFLSIRKISDVQKVADIGFWAKWRLIPRIDRRWEIILHRTIVGMISALIAGALAAWMNIIGTSPIPYWMLGIASGVVFVSIVLLFLTFYEFHVVSKLELELNRKAEADKRKQIALKSINGTS